MRSSDRQARVRGLMRFVGKSGSPRCDPARPSSTPWTIDVSTSPLPPLRMSDAIPRPLSPSLAGNFSFVHETAWSTAAYLMSLGSVVTRRRDAPILWTQMRHLRRTLSRKPQPQIVTHSPSDLTISNSRWSLNSRQRISA